jgi:AraC-like DNA-binding protein
MGITPKQYHQQCKVRKIKDMVFESSQSNIAYELNFTSQSHMNDVFKKYMGITTGSYSSAVEINEQ